MAAPGTGESAVPAAGLTEQHDSGDDNTPVPTVDAGKGIEVLSEDGGSMTPSKDKDDLESRLSRMRRVQTFRRAASDRPPVSPASVSARLAAVSILPSSPTLNGVGSPYSTSQLSLCDARDSVGIGNDARFLMSAAVQLMEQKTASDNRIAELLPSLMALIDAADSSFATKNRDSLHKLRQWATDLHQARESTMRMHGSSMCGWLRKPDKHSLGTQRRWVVLDGPNMMYYTDRSETNLKGVIQLQGATVTACTGLREIYRHSFEVAWGGAHAVTFNPLHSHKTHYKWIASCQADRDAWIQAIQAASGLTSDAPCLMWQQLLRSAPSADAYQTVLQRMPAARAFELSADWVRAQMAAHRKSSRADSSSAEVHAVLSAADLSAEKRRAGHAPGDRVTLEQFHKDVVRDQISINGTILRAAQADDALMLLAKAVAGAVTGTSDWPAPSECDSSSHTQARVLTFAREVLLCSSRTVAGGDAYDAVDLIFGNLDYVMIVPDSTSATPLEVIVEADRSLSTIADDASSDTASTTAPAASSGLASPGPVRRPSTATEGSDDTKQSDDHSDLDAIIARVQTTTTYKVMPLEVRSEHQRPWAVVTATFSRTFPWMGCPAPGTISLKVTTA